jgi:Fe-S cluster assembly iron-binding protein IscA
VTPPQREPILDYIPEFPEHRPFRKAWGRWWKETWAWLKHTVRPTEMELPDPVKRVARPAETDPPADLKERLAAAKALVDSAEKRLDTVRGKATSLLGFVALLTPILSWWLLTGRERVGQAPVPLAVIVYILMVVSAASLGLCLRALFRSQSVASFRTQMPSVFVDLDKGELCPHDWAGELIRQLDVWGDVQRWSDVVTDYFRAGQRFLGISLVTAVLAGTVSYFYPQPNKTIALVARPTGELAIQGPVTPTDPAAAAARWEAGAWYVSTAVAVAAAVFLLTRQRYKRVGPPAGKVPECRNLVRLTPAAAAKVREFLKQAPATYLRVTARRIGNEPVTQAVDVIGAVDPDSDYLGESEGVQIVVPRESAAILTPTLIDWVDQTDGRSGFTFSA